jgi:hypothetical protein
MLKRLAVIPAVLALGAVMLVPAAAATSANGDSGSVTNAGRPFSCC